MFSPKHQLPQISRQTVKINTADVKVNHKSFFCYLLYTDLNYVQEIKKKKKKQCWCKSEPQFVFLLFTFTDLNYVQQIKKKGNKNQCNDLLKIIWANMKDGFFWDTQFWFQPLDKVYFEGSRPEWCISSMVSRVPDQNGESLLYIMLEIHHSGREPSIYSRDTPFWSETLDI